MWSLKWKKKYTHIYIYANIIDLKHIYYYYYLNDNSLLIEMKQVDNNNNNKLMLNYNIITKYLLNK